MESVWKPLQKTSYFITFYDIQMPDAPENPGIIYNEISTKNWVLEKFLEKAPILGWSEQNLQESLKLCKIDSSYGRLVFKDGLEEIAEFFVKEKIFGNLENLAKEQSFLDLTKLHKKIIFLLEKSFEFLTTYRLAMLELSSFISSNGNLLPKNFLNFCQTTPQNFLKIPQKTLKALILGNFNKYQPPLILLAGRLCYLIADKMWFIAKDSSTDFNFYSKRASLAKVIFCSFLVFTKDQSPELQATKSKIHQQISKIITFAKNKKILQEKAENCLKSTSEIFFNAEGTVKSLKKITSFVPFLRLIIKNN